MTKRKTDSTKVLAFEEKFKLLLQSTSEALMSLATLCSFLSRDFSEGKNEEPSEAQNAYDSLSDIVDVKMENELRTMVDNFDLNKEEMKLILESFTPNFLSEDGIVAMKVKLLSCYLNSTDALKEEAKELAQIITTGGNKQFLIFSSEDSEVVYDSSDSTKEREGEKLTKTVGYN